MSNFAAEVRAGADGLMADALSIFRYSVQDLVEEVLLEGPSKGPPPEAGVGGWMPVQLGNLRRSLRASTSQMPMINPVLHKDIPDEKAAIILSITGAELGETLYLGFTAAYAAAVNYGHGNFSGYLFVEKAAAHWQEIVTRNEAKVAGMRGS